MILDNLIKILRHKLKDYVVRNRQLAMGTHKPITHGLVPKVKIYFSEGSVKYCTLCKYFKREP